MMPYKQNNQHSKPEESSQTQEEASGSEGELIQRAEEEEEATATISSSASATAFTHVTSREVPAALKKNVPLEAQGAPAPLVGLVLASQSQSNQGSNHGEQDQGSDQEEQGHGSDRGEQDHGSSQGEQGQGSDQSQDSNQGEQDQGSNQWEQDEWEQSQGPDPWEQYQDSKEGEEEEDQGEDEKDQGEEEEDQGEEEEVRGEEEEDRGEQGQGSDQSQDSNQGEQDQGSNQWEQDEWEQSQGPDPWEQYQDSKEGEEEEDRGEQDQGSVQGEQDQGSSQSEQDQASSQREQDQGSGQVEQDQGLCQREHEQVALLTPIDHVSILRNAQSLVPFLILKYRMRESTTKAEMLNLIATHREHFFEIFSRAAEYMQLVFGIEVIEIDPSDHCYFLTPAAGLTYDGMMSDVMGMPKTGLLIIILGIIFMENNCVSERSVWDMLSVMGVFPDTEHYIYGEPRKLIIENFVQEQYLEYRMVPNSDPACHEFLWGPRAHAETTKMRVLKHWVKFSGSDLSAYPNLCEQALRDERNARA